MVDVRGPYSESEASHERRAWWAVALITLLALVLRLIALNSGLWIDEILSLRDSFRAPLGTIVTRFPGDNHHPLYSVFARLSLVAFGESAWTVRLPAALFGAAAIPLVYLTARRVASRLESVFAAALLAVSYHHVWFSQNARGYTLIAFLTLASTVALLRALESPTAGRFVQYGLWSALAVYAHLTMVFLVAAHVLVAAVEYWRPTGGRRRINPFLPAVGFAVSGAGALLLYAPLLSQVLAYFGAPSDLEGSSTPAWALREAIRVLLLGVGAPVAIAGLIVLALGGLVGLLGIRAVWRTERNAALAFTLPALTTIAGALIGRGTMYPRFFFFLAGIAVILGVRGLFVTADLLASRVGAAKHGQRAGAILAAIVIAASAASVPANYRYPKQDFEGAMRFVEQSLAPGDKVGVAGAAGEPYRLLFGKDWPAVRTPSDLAALRSAGMGGRVWFIYTFPRYIAHREPGLVATIERECRDRVTFRGSVGGGDILVCVFDPA